MIKMAGYSHKGGRDYNEDKVGLLASDAKRCFVETWGIETETDEVKFSIEDGRERQCVVLADGLGGHGGGNLASTAAVDTILHNFANRTMDDDTEIKWLFNKANQEVLAIQTEKSKSKATCVALFVEKGIAKWAHLGDSRLYHFVDGTLVSYTTDHSVPQMAVMLGNITRDEIRFHEDRNRILKCLGVSEEVKPDISSVFVDDGRLHAFLLCSDGFWEYVLEKEMELELLQECQTPEEWIQAMLLHHQKRVVDKHDNYSAAVLFYKKTKGGMTGEKDK